MEGPAPVHTPGRQGVPPWQDKILCKWEQSEEFLKPQASAQAGAVLSHIKQETVRETSFDNYQGFFLT